MMENIDSPRSMTLIDLRRREQKNNTVQKNGNIGDKNKQREMDNFDNYVKNLNKMLLNKSLNI